MSCTLIRHQSRSAKELKVMTRQKYVVTKYLVEIKSSIWLREYTYVFVLLLLVLAIIGMPTKIESVS